MTAAILGGTFNPIHVGHLLVADITRRVHQYDRIIFVPSNRPAHKDVADGVSPQHRLKMVQLALRRRPGFVVDNCEIERGGTSYTIETVAELRERHVFEGKPAVLIGDDLIKGFENWRQATRLAQEVDLLVFHRIQEERLPFAFPHHYLENKPVAVSSTEIRERVRRGLSIRHLVPEPVRRYIARNNLYAPVRDQE